MSDKRRRVTYINDKEMAAVIALTERIIRDEGDTASRSYLNQRAGEMLGSYDLAVAKVNTLVATRAIKSVPGTRRGFPQVYVKGPSWDWVKAQAVSHVMDYDTLKRMNGH